MNPQQLMMLQGVPQIQTPTIPQPQMMMGQPNPNVPQSVGGQVVSGLEKFITNFRNTTQHEKAQAGQAADRDLKLLALGIPVDQQQILKNMTKAGIQLDKKVLQGDMPWQPGGQPGMQMETAGAPGLGPQQLGGPQGMPGPPVQQQAPQAPQPGLWDRLKTEMGLGQAPGPESPAAQWLGQYAQQGKERQGMMQKQTQLANLQMDNEMMKQTIIKSLGSDDPATAEKALDVAARMGMAQKTPFDEAWSIAKMTPGITKDELAASYLGMILGKDKIMAQYQKMAFEMKDNFGGDISKSFQYVKDLFEKGGSELQPGLDFKQGMEIGKRALELVEEYPGLPLNIARIYAHGQATGNKEITQGVEKMLTTKNEKGEPIFLNKGQYDLQYKNRTLAQGDQRISQAWQGLKQDRERLAQTWTIHSENFRLQAANTIANVGGKQFNDFQQLHAQAKKDGNVEQANAAVEGMAALMSKMAKLEIPVGKGPDGKDIVLNFSPGQMKAEEIERFFNPFNMWTNEKQLQWVDDINFTGKNPDGQAPKADLVYQMMQQWLKAAKVKQSDFEHFNSTF
jgi:hypothetical protein